MGEQLSRRTVLRRGAQIGLGTAVATGRSVAGQTVSDWRVEISKKDSAFDPCEYKLYADEGDGGSEVVSVLGGDDAQVTSGTFSDIVVRDDEPDDNDDRVEVSTTDVWEFYNTTKPLPELTAECDETTTEL